MFKFYSETVIQLNVYFKEEEAMLSEMEVTGQAFEDMQEQNSRLIQQLREKDDANFKLMTERIKSNQLHKLAREETDTLKELVSHNLFCINVYIYNILHSIFSYCNLLI